MPEPQADTHSGAEPERKPGWRTDLAASLASIGLGAWLFRETFSFSVTASERVGGGIDAAGYPRLLAGSHHAARAGACRPRALEMADGAGGGSACGRRGGAGRRQGSAPPSPSRSSCSTRSCSNRSASCLQRRSPSACCCALPAGAGPVHAAVAAVAFTAAIFVFFRYGVNIVLPEGLLRGISP